MSNRLAQETSPYLLQHANNPVEWWPWCDEAIQTARRHERPIFLSIGYSACHWCHVMEHESFENADIAALMNQWFVCIKVDREERPDLDQIYMSAVQAMTGSGGWPMSVFLTPELKPFFGGTYWPPSARWGRPGFREILAGVHDAWQNRRDAVLAQADELTGHVVSIAASTVESSPLNEEILRSAMRSLIRSADRVHGGFGSAPKFPHPMDLRVALRCWKRFGRTRSAELGTRSETAETAAPKAQYSVFSTQYSDDTPYSDDVLDIATLTLDKMARGGIYDHLGGGFARYSTDERWLAPHFEKMLYDNALLVPAYLEAHQITGRADFARVARETLDYVLREMTSPQGGFYATQDADSEGEEGKFFVWSKAEIESLLDPNDARAFCESYDVSATGNWEHKNILNRPRPHDDVAALLKLDPDDLETILDRSREKLFTERSKRIWPGRDEKVLASWNGLMIGAMAMGANVLGEPKYAEAARAAADFILREMVGERSQETGVRSQKEDETGADDSFPSTLDPQPSTRLLHSFKDGRARFNAYLDDYAALIEGLCELYQTVFDAKYLDAALSLAERMLSQFWDDADGGFFYTSADHEALIARNKETHDNATPSGNSLAATALLKLARLTGRMDLEEKAVATLEMMSGQLTRIPLAAGQALIALDFLIGPAHEVVVVEGSQESGDRSQETGDRSQNEERRSLALLHQRFVPNKVVHQRDAAIADEQLPAATRSLLSGKSASQGLTTVYVCQHGTCGRPLVGDRQIETGLAQL
ncbi:MAG: thioredoxin domain-containing protein [Planctomycetota bacterium]